MSPNRFKAQSMCERAVEKVPRVPKHVPDYFKTPEMCNKAVEVDPWQLKYVPKDLIIRVMCNRVVDDCSWELEHVPNQHKTRGMCNWAVSRHDVCLLQYVPDWLASRTCNGLVHARRRERVLEIVVFKII